VVVVVLSDIYCTSHVLCVVPGVVVWSVRRSVRMCVVPGASAGASVSSSWASVMLRPRAVRVLQAQVRVLRHPLLTRARVTCL
jgi:hypothetical protein